MAVAFDAASSTNGAAVTSLSFTHTPVGTPTAVGVAVGWLNTTQTITAMTYGGVAMTQEVTLSAGGGETRIYGLANPPSGAQTVAVSFSAATNAVLGAVTVTGSNTSDPFSSNNSASGSSTTASVAVTSSTSELVMDNALTTTTVTVGTGQTQRWNSSPAVIRVAGSTEPGAASVTMDWALGASAAWITVGASFKDAAGATHAATGALTGPGAVVVGAASSATVRAASGALVGSGAVIAGAASSATTRAASGALVGQGAVVAGTASSSTVRAADGALAGQGAAVSGTAAHIATHTSAGTLTGPGAAVSGAAVGSGVAPQPSTAAGGGIARPRRRAPRAAVYDMPLKLPTIHAASGHLTGPGASLAGRCMIAETMKAKRSRRTLAMLMMG